MPSSNIQIALPTKLSKVVIQKKSKTSDPQFKENYDKGWEAGYKAATWKAELEAKQQSQQQAAEAAEWIKRLNSMHEELLKLVSTHLPQLLLCALSKVIQHHKFTDEEIFQEIQAMIQELSLAKSISIECSQEDMENLQKRLDSLSLTQGQVQWTANPSFQSGEYVMQSDLGVLDGRRSTKIAHVHAALKNLL